MSESAFAMPDDQRLFLSYQPLPGVPDELCDGQGGMRPVWSGLVNHLSSLSPAQLAEAFARGDQHLADTGVFFRNYADQAGATRDWPYSPIPIILPQSEWEAISAGLIQRADLLEQVVADLYGEGSLVRNGHLPASLIAQNPEWLRPMVGVRPRSGHFLQFIAFEIGRGPNGQWWVLNDRMDAPSGAGFALENRVATARVFPEVYRQANVYRLAGFFRSLRDRLQSLGSDPAARISLLTPGPLTDTYYEQAYIARYLGIALLEGEDLTVEDGRVWVRTVEGLKPVDVLWRRMDGMWSDPLELREDSRLGTPGLMSAIRQGNVTMMNALGVGVLEAQVMMAFLPKIARVLNGAPLKMPNVATWWCGQPKELEHVRANAGRMMIGPALATRMPFETGAVHAIGGQMRGHNGPFQDWLSQNAGELVGQELVTLSTTPVMENNRLVPRPMSVRVFLARTAQGWKVMPGGFARVGGSDDNMAISMRNGGGVADVWIVGNTPVPLVSLHEQTHAPFVRAHTGALPSRAADNMFWLGRYVERTEGLLRLVRAYNGRLYETGTEPLLDVIRAHLNDDMVDTAEPFPQGVLNAVASAINSASQIRDRFSIDGWAALKDMEKSMIRAARSAQPGNDAAYVMSVMLRKIAGFSGLVHENMYRTTGWQFLTIGRSLERSAMMTKLLAKVADPAAPDGGLDLAIEVGDSVMTHRQRYAVFTGRDSTIDLLVLDENNPRSVLFHLNMIHKTVSNLSHGRDKVQKTAFERQVLALQTSVAVQSVETLDTAALLQTHAEVLDLSPALNAAFLH